MCAASNGNALLKITFHGSTFTILPALIEREALRFVHPGVGGDDGHRAADSGHHDRYTGPEMRPWLQPAPAVDVDRDEDRLGEEEQTLDRERDSEGCAEASHECRPQQPELERQDRPRDCAYRERHGHVLRPTLGELQGRCVVVLHRSVVRDERHERPRNTERNEDDVEAERERHLRTRPLDRIDREHRRIHLVPDRVTRCPPESVFGHELREHDTGCGLEQREMREGLGEVPEMPTGVGVEFFRVQAEWRCDA